MCLDKKWQVFFLVAFSLFMSTLDSSIVNVALPFIMTDLSQTMGTIQWVVTVYLLFVSSFLLTFGRLSDIIGRPRVYRLGFAVFTLGSFLCAISGTAAGLILSRAVQGMGASMLMACSPALIVDAFEPANRGRALGLMGTCVAAGLTLGPVAGGFILEYFAWPTIFYINIPVGLVALVWSRWALKPKRGHSSHESMDIYGSLFMAIWVASFIIGLIRSPDWGFFSFKGGGCWAIGIMAFIGFVVHAQRAVHPLLDLGLLRVRRFSLPLGAALFLFAALFSLVFMMPFYLSLICGFSPAKTGLIMIVPFIFLLVISPVSGGLADRLGSMLLCSAGMGCLAISLAFMATLSPSTGEFGLFWRLSLAGMGTALFVSPNSAAIMGAVPAEHRGIAAGTMATARNLGMVVGVALASSIFTRTFTGLTQGVGLDHYTPGMAPFFMTGFRYAMAAGVSLALLGFGLTLAYGNDLRSWKKP
ncbi:MAG: MFS transporter [Desulfobacter sp.]|nr:MAG: MFS transporter [Desulfobacter sp.]